MGPPVRPCCCPKPISSSPRAGMSTLCQALAANEAIGSSLRHLDLSGNPGSLALEDTTVSMGQRCRGLWGGWRGPGRGAEPSLLQSLQSLLGRCASLTHLSLAATDCSLDTVSPNPLPWGSAPCPFWSILGSRALSERCFSSPPPHSSLGRWSEDAAPAWSTWTSPKTRTRTGEPRITEGSRRAAGDGEVMPFCALPFQEGESRPS